MDLVGAIQQVIQQNIQAQQLSDIAFGTVTSISPLTISLDINLPELSGEALVLTQAVKTWDETVRFQGSNHDQIIHHYGLNVNDRVIMLRVSAGQRYIVLSRL